MKHVALWACLAASPLSADSLTHIGTYTWPTEAIVGLSGLEVSDDGMAFAAVGDRGWFVSGRFTREDEMISEVMIDQYLPILGSDGMPAPARRVNDLSDAEGLALAADGTYWISFERWARVARFTSPTEPAGWIKDHEMFRDFADNRQLEALALHPDGSLYTFPEKPERSGFPIFRLDGATWTIAGHIPAANRFSIVGADFDQNGNLYLLERKLNLGLWWQNRIRRLRIETPEDIETLWTGSWGEYFNVEGLAVWRDEDGIRLTLVSDNNADRSEPTQFIEYRLIAED